MSYFSGDPSDGGSTPSAPSSPGESSTAPEQHGLDSDPIVNDKYGPVQDNGVLAPSVDLYTKSKSFNAGADEMTDGDGTKAASIDYSINHKPVSQSEYNASSADEQ